MQTLDIPHPRANPKRAAKPQGVRTGGLSFGFNTLSATAHRHADLRCPSRPGSRQLQNFFPSESRL